MPLLLQTLSVRSKVIGVLFVVYLVLQIQSFRWAMGHEFLYMLIKFSVGAVIFGLLLSAKFNGVYKLAAVAGYFVLLFTIGKLNLWTISARAYLQDNQPVLSRAAVLLQTKGNVSISKANGINGPKLNLSISEKATLLLLFEQTNIIEIEVDKGNILFIFDRFIDNGYAFMYLGNPNRLTANYPRVVYDLTSKILLERNWYSVSFT